MKVASKWILWAVIGLALAAGVIYLFLPKPMPVEVAAVTRGRLTVTVEQDGQTRVRERYVVAAPLAGRLRRVQLEEGDRVEAGVTELAVIEPAPPPLLDRRTRLGAEAAVGAAEAAQAEARTRIARAEAQLAQARRELARLEAVAERSAATDIEVQRAELAVATRDAELHGAEFALAFASFQLREAQAVLARIDDHAARGDGGTSADPDAPAAGEFPEVHRIIAPISGVVLRVVQESETVVTPGTTLLELGAPNDLEAVIDVLSPDAVQIVPGAAVELHRWGGEDAIPGVVRRVEPSGFTKISALGVEEQRVNVIVDFASPPPDARESLGDGYRVDAAIVTWEADDVLRVPTAALFRQEREWAVFVVRDGRATLQRVALGAMNAQMGQVVEGLAQGDQVILYPSDKILPGVLVEPLREVLRED